MLFLAFHVIFFFMVVTDNAATVSPGSARKQDKRERERIRFATMSIEKKTERNAKKREKYKSTRSEKIVRTNERGCEENNCLAGRTWSYQFLLIGWIYYFVKNYSFSLQFQLNKKMWIERICLTRDYGNQMIQCMGLKVWLLLLAGLSNTIW